jgi:hypothetical protein
MTKDKGMMKVFEKLPTVAFEQPASKKSALLG